MHSTPCRPIMHNMASATAVNTFGADRNPNGRALSTYVAPSHLTPSNSWSCGCTGTRRLALSRSNYANSAPWPRPITVLTASSTVIYLTEQTRGSIPSFIVVPSGVVVVPCCPTDPMFRGVCSDRSGRAT